MILNTYYSTAVYDFVIEKHNVHNTFFFQKK